MKVMRYVLPVVAFLLTVLAAIGLSIAGGGDVAPGLAFGGIVGAGAAALASLWVRHLAGPKDELNEESRDA